ncbi:MAG: nucleotidyltransferase family protein, partial [Gammaproteobacteria bacterium]|nr:nucleotidyltransferase family protein [Gammaproteobacteria bacterium]
MSLAEDCLLIQLLSGCRKIESFTLAEWDLIIRQARVSKLVAGLAGYIDDVDVIPQQVMNHIQSVCRQAERTKLSAQYEIELIEAIAKWVNFPVIILKGAAYVIRNYSAGEGRLFSDVDILVPKKHVYELENKFVEKGWYGEKLHPYDQKYYRKWMHELPPLTNSRTGSSLDLHHNILPETADIKTNVSLMIGDAIPVEGYRNIYTFSPCDIVLHSLTHLFHEGEFDHGLRDLLDVHRLVASFVEIDDQFWSKVLARAYQLNLSLPLFYGVRYLRLLLKTKIPNFVIESLQEKHGCNHRIMDFLFTRALMPNHISCDDAFSGISRWCLYV